jgi:hypothetical protein
LGRASALPFLFILPQEDTMFDVTVTINTDTREYDDVPFKGDSLDDIWKQIVVEYPSVTSVVFVFCKP